MLLVLTIAGLLLLQPRAGDATLAKRIHQLLMVVLTTDDDQQSTAAVAEAQQILTRRGLPTVAAVGDEAAYEFVFLTCSAGPEDSHQQVLRMARDGARRHEIPVDAATYCAAHVRQEMATTAARKHAPSNPGLFAEIGRLIVADQAVRQKGQFDMQKMSQTDREHQAALEAIFVKYGVPTFRMVGPQAASDFITMIQHQSPAFRSRVLPRLKANVDAGQADPGSYAKVFDRSRTDAGKKQLYGENLTCDSEHPKLHVGAIEDERNVNQRRAAIGLMRLEMYAALVVAMSPDFCAATPEVK